MAFPGEARPYTPFTWAMRGSERCGDLFSITQLAAGRGRQRTGTQPSPELEIRKQRKQNEQPERLLGLLPHSFLEWQRVH